MAMTWDEIQAEVNKQREENMVMRKLAEPEEEIDFQDLTENLLN